MNKNHFVNIQLPLVSLDLHQLSSIPFETDMQDNNFEERQI